MIPVAEERTTEILKRFLKSWDDTEAFYKELINNHSGWEKLEPLVQFILFLRSNGADKHFRAGTSVHTLVLSRSVDFGLRLDQKCIRIEVIGISDFEVVLRDGQKIYREYRIKDLGDERLAKLLKTLKSTLVD